MPQLPAHWLERCESPAVNVRTNAGIALGLQAYETSLRECSGRIEDIGNWLTLQGLVIDGSQPVAEDDTRAEKGPSGDAHE